jgi:hypothetical protein
MKHENLMDDISLTALRVASSLIKNWMKEMHFLEAVLSIFRPISGIFHVFLCPHPDMPECRVH